MREMLGEGGGETFLCRRAKTKREAAFRNPQTRMPLVAVGCAPGDPRHLASHSWWPAANNARGSQERR